MEEFNFKDLNLSDKVLKAISDMGFEELSPIQREAIPKLLGGSDVIGQAQTGTGKTAAFGIPIVERCDEKNKNIQAMVLCPTRELTIQVAEEISRLAKYKRDLHVLPVYGGQPIERQIKAIKKGVQIIIGTPGRVIDHIRRKTIKTDSIHLFVLDEADEMFAMGFRDDMELVISHLPEEKNTLFFSATMPKAIIDFAKKYQKNPVMVKVLNKELTVPMVNQYYFDVRPHMKTEILSRVLDIYNPQLTVVFCNTKKRVDELTGELQGRGYFADGLHGDLKQVSRDVVMKKFRKGSIDILVATDVAARGIDVDDVDLVINYDMPQDNEYYVHRIGRTARAGRYGTAISFVSGRETSNLREIQKYTKTKIEKIEIPTLKDIEKNHGTKLLDLIRQGVDTKDTTKEQMLLEILLEEGYTAKDIAAYLFQLLIKEKKMDNHEELDSIDNDKKKERSRRDTRDSKKGRNGKKNKSGNAGFKKIFINIGKNKNVSPRHILSAILQETGISSKEVGHIDIYDRYTFVEIASKKVDQVVREMDRRHIRGSKIVVEHAK